SLDLAKAGHVASAYSEPGGELGEARERRDEAARASGWAGVTVRSRPSAGHVAMAAAAVWLILSGLLDAMTGLTELSLFSIAPLALLPPLPPEMTGMTIAARYRSATREASVGGDLYEIIPTGHGIRVIIGDVRGKGLGAVLLARQVLSAFRRSAVAMPAMEHV